MQCFALLGAIALASSNHRFYRSYCTEYRIYVEGNNASSELHLRMPTTKHLHTRSEWDSNSQFQCLGKLTPWRQCLILEAETLHEAETNFVLTQPIVWQDFVTPLRLTEGTEFRRLMMIFRYPNCCVRSLVMAFSAWTFGWFINCL